METVAVRSSKRQVGVTSRWLTIFVPVLFFSPVGQLRLCGFHAWDCAGIFFQNICAVLQNP